MKPRRPGDDPFSFSRAERAALTTLVVIGALGLASGYWLPPLVRWVAPAPVETLDTAYVAAVDSWIARATLLADSIAEAREARRARAIAREAEWKARRAGWAAEKQARAARRERYASRDYKSYDRGASRGWQDYPSRKASPSRWSPDSTRGAYPQERFDTPEPPPGSLDPNNVDSATLRRLGLPVGLTRRWLKYRAAGGSFVSAADVAKLYGMPDTTAQRITRYFATSTESAAAKPVAEAGATPSGQAPGRPRGKRPPDFVEVNHATVEDLTALRGVGNYFAGRIIDYRGRLGGFVSVEQVAETPGLRDSTYQAIATYLRVDTTYRFRIPLNRATTWQELRHPYMSIAAAKMTFAYREQHGPYRSAADLRRVKALKPEDIAALSPYLDFGQ